MADTATHAVAGRAAESRNPADLTTPDATVTLPQVRPDTPGSPGGPHRQPDPRRSPDDPPSPLAPATSRPDGADPPSRRRGRSGPFSGITLALPGRRGPRSDGGGRGGRRFPLRPGDGGDGVDLRNTWQVVAGSLLVPLGVVFILMSWYGAAHTPYVQQQIPYLVSGSFAGVACIVLGGLLYWAHWLYRIYDQADLHHQEQLDALHQTLRVIAERLDGSGDGSGSRPATDGVTKSLSDQAAGSPVSSDTQFVASEDGTYYHLPACPVVSHHSEGMRPVGAPGLGAMEPCRICRPGEAGANGPATEARDGGPARPDGRT